MKGTQPLLSNDFLGLFSAPSPNGNDLNHFDESDRDRTNSAASMQRLKAWLTLALQSADIGVWEWDIAAGHMNVSSHCTQTLGFVGRYVAPRSFDGWLDLVHPEDAPGYDRFIAALMSGRGIVRQVETRLRRPDGTYSWQLFRGQMLDGERAIGVLLDVTAKHETVSRLLQIERLETIGQLTGGLAHDFNNLLTVIQGNVELLNDNLGGDALNAPILEEIGSVVDRGAALTRRLLSFAREDRPATVRVDPDVLVAGLLPLLRHTLGGRIALRTEFAANGWTVDADARQFENAIINLAINARDAMAGGGLLSLETHVTRLTVRDVDLEHDEKPGAYVVVGVGDTGHGMPPEVLARIFEPFFTTKADKGTGLGIPMVARFVRQCGGHIRIESIVGSGTTMRLYIPKSAAPI